MYIIEWGCAGGGGGGGGAGMNLSPEEGGEYRSLFLKANVL